ncbi:glycosyltransferase family 2 protein [Candidatus Nitrospira salsa]
MGHNLALSVIIPCLNGEATLAQQLDALAAQQWDHLWELVIVDNGSTDKSVEIAQQYAGFFSHFQILDASAKKGGSYAINRGADAATSNYLAVCDSDDEVEPGWVASMGEALQVHDIVCGKFRFDKFNDPRTAQDSAEAWKDGLYTGRFLPGGGSGNFGVRRALHERVGGFDECLPHAYDADYFWRIQLEGFALHYVPEAAIQIRIARVNQSLRSIYYRSKNRFASNYWCYKRYRVHGMLPPPSLTGSALQLIRTIKSGVQVCLSKSSRKDSWLQRIFQQTGEVVGQMQGRLTNPCKPFWPGQSSKR